MRRRRSGGEDDGDGRSGALEIGAADRRLDQLIEQETRRRAQSMDAGVRRLNASQAQTEGPPSSRVQQLPPPPAGQPVMLSPGQGAAMVQAMQMERPAGLPELQDRQELHPGYGAQPGGLGLLQGAVQQTYQVVRHALGRDHPGQGLLGPLSEGLDPGVHGGLLLGGVPQQVSGQEAQLPVPPRVLEYGPTDTPARGNQPEVNPFWSLDLFLQWNLVEDESWELHHHPRSNMRS